MPPGLWYFVTAARGNEHKRRHQGTTCATPEAGGLPGNVRYTKVTSVAGPWRAGPLTGEEVGKAQTPPDALEQEFRFYSKIDGKPSALF